MRESARATWTALALVVLFTMLGASTVVAAQSPDLPVPIVTLERAELIGGADVRVTLWFSGPQTETVDAALVTFVGPPFLELRDPLGLSGQGDPGATGTLGPFQGPGPIELTLATVGTVSEGRFTLAFGIRYRAGEPPQLRAAVVEKTVDVGLLGVGAVAGVPLQFATYLLPGLIAVMVAKMLQVGWASRLGPLELAAFSVILSMLLLLVGERLIASPLLEDWGLRSLDIVTLGAGGLMLGILFALPQWLVVAGRLMRAKRAAADLVAAGDSFATMVAKAFRQGEHAGAGKAVIVETVAGASYAGSVAARLDDGRLVLLGWQRLQRGDPTLAKLARDGQWSALASRLGDLPQPLALEPYNLVRRRDGDDWVPAAESEYFKTDEIKATRMIDFADLGTAGTGFAIEIDTT